MIFRFESASLMQIGCELLLCEMDTLIESCVVVLADGRVGSGVPGAF